MSDMPEDEFLRRVADSALIEARARRHALRRAQRTGLTEEQLRLHEDLAFWNISRELRRTEQLADAERMDAEIRALLAAAEASIPTFGAANKKRIRRTDRNAAIARELVAKGWSLEEIAKKAKRSTKTVERWLERDLP